MMAQRMESSLAVKRCAARCHHRFLIATDLDDASVILPMFEHVDHDSRIAVFGTYRIPFCGLHTLLGVPRLERELAARTRERMIAFVESTGVAPSRFDLLICRGDPHDHVVREARARASDLVVLAFGRSCRAQRRAATLLLEQTSCDLVIVQGERPRPSWLRSEALVAFGPWAC